MGYTRSKWEAFRGHAKVPSLTVSFSRENIQVTYFLAYWYSICTSTQCIGIAAPLNLYGTMQQMFLEATSLIISKAFKATNKLAI